MNKHRYTIPTLAGFIASVLLNAKHVMSSEVDILHDWVNLNYPSITLSVEDSKHWAFLPTTKTLIDIWKQRDGALSGEVSPLLIKAIKAQPELTLSLLSEYPISFDKWLNELDGMVFTDVSGTEKASLEKLRLDTIESLGDVSRNAQPLVLDMKERLLTRLDGITVRVID